MLNTKNFLPAFLVIEEHAYYMNMRTIEIFTHVSFKMEDKIKFSLVLFVALCSNATFFNIFRTSTRCENFRLILNTWQLYIMAIEIFSLLRVQILFLESVTSGDCNA